MLLAVLGKGVDKIVIALVTVQWAYYARTVRGAALVERGKEYIEAAECLALPTPRIIFRHLLPNCLPPLIVDRDACRSRAPSRSKPRCPSWASACRSPSRRWAC